MTKPLIRVCDIYKTYNQQKVLQGPSFEIQPGTFTTLLGANGSGKSTLLRLIAGSEFPDGGEVFFKDELAHGWKMKNKQDMFYINENIQIESSLTMNEFAKNFSKLFPRWHHEFFEQMVKDRKIDLKRNYHQYSRGQKMQLNLMMALAACPEVLLLDEITSVMDVYARRYFLGVLHRYCQSGKTVVMTTNIISELQFYTTHLLLLQNGKMKLNGPLDEVRDGFVKLRFPTGSSDPLLQRTDLRWAGVNGDGSENYLLNRQTAEVLQISDQVIDRREITLEDIFIYHYGDQEEVEHANAA